jgi:hypothetical protein
MRTRESIAKSVTIAAGVIALTAASALAGDTILSSENFEGEAATYYLQTSANSPSVNVDYMLPDAFQHNNSWINGHIASVNGPAEGTDPTGQHILTRSSTGNFILSDPLPLITGGYTNMTISFAVNVRFVDAVNALYIDYSANGLFSDSQNLLTLTSTTNLSGVAYEQNRWYADQNITLDPGTYSFTDTAKIRVRSGGWANSTQILLDDIVITGHTPPAGTVLIIK